MVLAFSTVVVGAIAGVVLFANLDSERQVQSYMSRGGQYGLTGLVEELESYFEAQGSWDGVDTVISSTNARRGQNGQRGGNYSDLTLTDAARRVIWSSTGEIIGAVLDKEDIENAIQLQPNGNEIAGYLVVKNTSQVQADELSPFVTRLRSVLVYAGVLAAILAVGLAILISNYLLKPVKALTKASNELSSGDFSTRVEIKGNDELAVLGSTFNQMAGNLQLAEERKKTLTADVAHELRTPISVQKAQLEGMLDGVLPVTQENLSIALQQTDFLSRMVDDLRLLAMADAGEVQFEHRETDLKKLILQITTQFQAQMQNEGTRISCTFTPEDANLVIDTDPDRLTQILHNLLSNAARYGRKGGNITVSTNVYYETVHIAVKDDGSGIPDSALPHLFERFYRHEKARSRETGGTGLGLAISKNLALLMGGDLTGVNDPDGGAVFTLSLPMKK